MYFPLSFETFPRLSDRMDEWTRRSRRKIFGRKTDRRDKIFYVLFPSSLPKVRNRVFVTEKGRNHADINITPSVQSVLCMRSIDQRPPPGRVVVFLEIGDKVSRQFFY